jgi:hypothetical protein
LIAYPTNIFKYIHKQHVKEINVVTCNSTKIIPTRRISSYVASHTCSLNLIFTEPSNTRDPIPLTPSPELDPPPAPSPEVDPAPTEPEQPVPPLQPDDPRPVQPSDLPPAQPHDPSPVDPAPIDPPPVNVPVDPISPQEPTRPLSPTPPAQPIKPYMTRYLLSQTNKRVRKSVALL